MDPVAESLHRCSSLHHNEGATAVFQTWCEGGLSEELLGAAVFTLATSCIGGATFEEQVDSAIGLERCLAFACEHLDADAVGRLQRSVVERTLRRLDDVGSALAARASERLLWPEKEGCAHLAEAITPLRMLFQLLLRCHGAENISGKEVLDLCGGDVALAIALLAEGLASPKVAGLPQLHTRLVRMLYQLTTPDAFGWLLEHAQISQDLNATPIGELQGRRSEHCRVIALSFVQFDVMEKALRAAEEPSQREVVMSLYLRSIQNLVASEAMVEPGRLLSRQLSLDFMRVGFRFMAPLVRKLVDACHSDIQVRLLRLICVTLSWLLVHAEIDGSDLLMESLKPLVTEWTLRAIGRAVPYNGLASLVILAANCHRVDIGKELPPTEVQLFEHILAVAAAPDGQLREQITSDLRRTWCLASSGSESLAQLGFQLPDRSDLGGHCPVEDDEVDDADLLLAAGHDSRPDDDEENEATAGCVQVGEPLACSECNKPSMVGCVGEGYFDGLWYCQFCWVAWDDASPGLNTLTSWSTSNVTEVPREQRGAASMLLQVPGWLRCGVSGMVLTSSAVRLHGTTAQPVAFDRRSLERWYRRSRGKSPITGQAVDLREVIDAPDVLEAVRAWITQQLFLRGVGVEAGA